MSSIPAINAKVVTFDERFLAYSWKWLNDPEIKRLTMSPDFTKETQLNWYRSLSQRQDYLVWGVELDGEPAGVFGIKNIQPPQGEYWGYIGDKTLWGRGLGMFLVDAAFERAKTIGLSNLCLKVWRPNVRARKMYEKMGFQYRSEEQDVVWMVRGLAA